MTRAMTLIKMYFVGTLKAVTADIQRRMAEKVRFYIINNAEALLIPVKGSLRDGRDASALLQIPIRWESDGTTYRRTRRKSYGPSRGTVKPSCGMSDYIFPVPQGSHRGPPNS